MENYAEALIKGKVTALTRCIQIFGFVIGFVVATMLIASGSIVIAPLGLILLFCMFYYLPNLSRVEYEYVYCDGQIDFDRIVNGNKRKTVKRIDIKNALLIAPYTADELKQYSDCTKKKYISGNLERMYVIVQQEEKENVAIYFEPSDKMMELMASRCGHRFIKK